MISRPILFSAPMVRALLGGVKTQTRRAITPQPDSRPGMDCTRLIFKDRKGNPTLDEALESKTRTYLSLCPYGQPGDQLVVRETFFAFGRWETRFNAKKGRDEWHFVDMTVETGHAYCYAADGGEPALLARRRSSGVMPAWWKRPAIFMPRAAARITLKLTEVRVERLAEISQADAMAEGVWTAGSARSDDIQHTAGGSNLNHIGAYRKLWSEINNDQDWIDNVWVWVVAFRRLP